MITMLLFTPHCKQGCLSRYLPKQKTSLINEFGYLMFYAYLLLGNAVLKLIGLTKKYKLKQQLNKGRETVKSFYLIPKYNNYIKKSRKNLLITTNFSPLSQVLSTEYKDFDFSFLKHYISEIAHLFHSENILLTPLLSERLSQQYIYFMIKYRLG